MSPPTAPDAPASDRAAPHPMLERFSPAVATWFHTTFPEPTAAQARGWEAIVDGDHTLILAPTGSGKTLAAFLWAIDRQVTSPEPERSRHLGVVYVSPLRALAVDVERNLRAPLHGIRLAAERMGVEVCDVQVGVRTGDTPSNERQRMARPDERWVSCLQGLVADRRLRRLQVDRVNGQSVHDTAWAERLRGHGFVDTPRGLVPPTP